MLSRLTNAAGCILAPAGMVNWWPAEGNPNDIFGANSGTPHNGFSYAPGKQGRAFHFDDSSGYLVTGAPSVPAPWTACLWVNRQNAPGSGAALMGDGAYELKLKQYNGTRQVGLTRFGVGDYSFGYIAPTGVWTHLAFVSTSTGTALYVNGVLQSTSPDLAAWIPLATVPNPTGSTQFTDNSATNSQTLYRASQPRSHLMNRSRWGEGKGEGCFKVSRDSCSFRRVATPSALVVLAEGFLEIGNADYRLVKSRQISRSSLLKYNFLPDRIGAPQQG